MISKAAGRFVGTEAIFVVAREAGCDCFGPSLADELNGTKVSYRRIGSGRVFALLSQPKFLGWRLGLSRSYILYPTQREGDGLQAFE